MKLVADQSRRFASHRDAAGHGWRRIALNDIPQWCSHVAALFQQDRPYGKRSRRASVGEYELHYAACLNYCRELGEAATFDDVRLYQAGIVRRGFESCLPCQKDEPRIAMLPGGQYVIDLNYFGQTFHRRPLEETGELDGCPAICASVGDELFEVPLDEAFRANPARLADEIGRGGGACRTVVELGAGFGYNLSRIRERLASVKLVCADASPAAIETARRLFRDDAGASVRAFDFYDAASYEFLATLDAPILVYTSAAIEQLPSAAPLFDGLEPYRAKIERVLHLEPVYRDDDNGLLGMLRRRYIDTWDYTRDLMTQIEGRANIELLREEQNVFGVNPLNPLSLLEWRYSA